jgi:hypothetical protein
MREFIDVIPSLLFGLAFYRRGLRRFSCYFRSFLGVPDLNGDSPCGAYGLGFVRRRR